jgi:disease resistance protein RPM1
MPPEVGELEHLLSLDVRSTLLDGLPYTVVKLHKLERLLFSSRRGISIRWKMPRGVKKMKALREVGKVVLTPDIQVAKEIGELDQLQKLGIYANSDEHNYGVDVLEAFAISLSKMHSLRWLNIGDAGYKPYVLDFLHRLPSPPRLLRYLRIAAQINKLPSWIGTLTNLVEFTMSWGHLVDDQLYEVLCNLPNLESIFMEGHVYVGKALVARTAFKFPVLRDLKANIAPEVEEGVYEFEEGSMTQLETLSIDIHEDRHRKIVGVEHLPNLKEVKLYGAKENLALQTALEQLNAESKKRDQSSRFKVAVKYD